MFADDETPKKNPVFEIGQKLEEMSVEEISKTIAVLEEEIVRLKTAQEAKSAHLNAAEALFSAKT